MKRKMNIDDAMMSSLGMLSDYENTDTNKINKIASRVVDSSLEKVAGIFINNPTQENIEDFIRKYMYNELTFFPRILEVIVDFIPSSFDKVQKDYVSDGTGVVGIKVHQKAVELPFIVRDGDLVPFDIIQMDGQRAPYSRENLQRIIINLDKQISQENQVGGGTDSPYQGLEDYNNPSTSSGFMGDVLAIRDTQSMKRGGNGMYATAAEYDYGFDIEKKATTTPGFSSMERWDNAKDISPESMKENISFLQSSIKDQKWGKKYEDQFNNSDFLKYDNGDFLVKNKNTGKVQEWAHDAEDLLDFKEEKKASEKYNVFPFSEKERDSLEHQFDKAVAKVEKEKSTTPAPKGTVEKEKEEEKLAKEHQYVCGQCGVPRDEDKEPHCKKCGHDHTTTKEDFDKSASCKNVCEQCGTDWPNDEEPGCSNKKCGHDMSVNRKEYHRRQEGTEKKASMGDITRKEWDQMQKDKEEFAKKKVGTEKKAGAFADGMNKIKDTASNSVSHLKDRGAKGVVEDLKESMNLMDKDLSALNKRYMPKKKEKEMTAGEALGGGAHGGVKYTEKKASAFELFKEKIKLGDTPGTKYS